ncbi:hypothetical protein HanRHA438_Chr01g0032181 [Helianthus annuus]|nr:hypothetical protein HanRHA438_Chr01g0032181 [Helianthus annuus]
MAAPSLIGKQVPEMAPRIRPLHPKSSKRFEDFECFKKGFHYFHTPKFYSRVLFQFISLYVSMYV